MERVTSMALIYKMIFSSISTFETPPRRRARSEPTACVLHGQQSSYYWLMMTPPALMLVFTFMVCSPSPRMWCRPWRLLRCCTLIKAKGVPSCRASREPSSSVPDRSAGRD